MPFELRKSLLILSAVTSSSVGACPLVPGQKISAAQVRELNAQASKKVRGPNQILDVFYGGTEASKWTIESILANRFQTEIEAAMKKSDVKDVVVSVPALIQDGKFSPFGDGQTNSQPHFGIHWANKKEIPLVVRREFLKAGGFRDVITAHPSVNAKSFVTQQRGETLFVQPQGWSNWFVVSFKHQILPISEFVAKMPANFTLPGGKKLPDPQGIVSEKKGKSAYQTLLSHQFTPSYLGPFPPNGGVHDRFPGPDGAVTAVGGVTTWLVEAPVKHLYTCFSGRNLQAEADHGVPSGAGWHRVGTFSETVLNSLEEVPILVALGRLTEDPVPSGEMAYGLNAVITAKYLKPAEALMTNRGQFHWYAISSSQEACTEILVHPCVPDALNQMGFNCQ